MPQCVFVREGKYLHLINVLPSAWPLLARLLSGSQEDERRVCGAGWGGVGVWHSEWGAGGETESAHRPLLWWGWFEGPRAHPSCSVMLLKSPKPVGVWKARAESRHIHGDVCERDSLTWYCFSSTNTPQFAMPVKHIEVLRDRKSAEQWKSVLINGNQGLLCISSTACVWTPGGW